MWGDRGRGDVCCSVLTSARMPVRDAGRAGTTEAEAAAEAEPLRDLSWRRSTRHSRPGKTEGIIRKQKPSFFCGFPFSM